MPSAQPHRREDEGALERADRAFARLQTAWQDAHCRILSTGNGQITLESIRELDAAEEDWLAAREAIALHNPTTR